MDVLSNSDAKSDGGPEPKQYAERHHDEHLGGSQRQHNVARKITMNTQCKKKREGDRWSGAQGYLHRRHQV